MDTSTIARPLGRPRDPRLDEAIAEAALELLAEVGYTALTMEAVAALAGVGKATLYRRWAGKEQLVVDALQSLSEPTELAVGATVREQLVTLLEAMRRKGTASRAGKILPRLLSAGAEHPELMERYRRQVLEPRRARFLAVLRRAVTEGLVRPDVDLGYATDLMVGPVLYRSVIRTDPPPASAMAEHVVDDVLRALAPFSSSPCSDPDPNEDV